MGICSGNMFCATCHIYVADNWRDKVGPKKEGEDMIIDGLPNVTRRSRFGCQIQYSDELDGVNCTLVS